MRRRRRGLIQLYLVFLASVASCLCATAPALGKAPPPPSVAGTAWRVVGTGKFKAQAFEDERWRKLGGAQPFELFFVARFEAGGRFTLEDAAGNVFSEGVWTQKKSSVVFELGAAWAPAGAVGGALGGVPASGQLAEVGIESWKLKASIKSGKDGALSLRCKYAFRFAADGSAGTHRYSGKSKGEGVSVGPPPKPNAPPRARAVVRPSDGVVVLSGGVGKATLDASASDDGDGGAQRLSFRWRKTSGPSKDSIADASAAVTEVTFQRGGAYDYEVTVDDGAFSDNTARATVRIRVQEENQPPRLRVTTEPEDGILYLEDTIAEATLDGSASDDGGDGPGTLEYAWSLVSGPGDAFIADPTGPRTVVGFIDHGTYLFQLEVGDGATVNGTSVTRVQIEVRRTDGTARLVWARPQENEDGSLLDDLAGFRVYYGLCRDPGRCDQRKQQTPAVAIDVGDVTTYTVRDLRWGATYYFQVAAYDKRGNESQRTGAVFKTFD